MTGRLRRELIKTKYVCFSVLLHLLLLLFLLHLRGMDLLTMLEGFEREPEEDDGVEEAIQTMGPENLREDEREKRD